MRCGKRRNRDYRVPYMNRGESLKCETKTKGGEHEQKDSPSSYKRQISKERRDEQKDSPSSYERQMHSVQKGGGQGRDDEEEREAAQLR
jgi:hypothetical protein